MDIRSGKGYPAAALSNFTPHRFVLDDVEICSMEGFLQSLKFNNLDMQAFVCTLVGVKAKHKGKPKRWWLKGKLYWRVKEKDITGNDLWVVREIDRFGQEYQELLDRAYDAMAEQSDSFRRALLASGDAVLRHSIGKNDEHRTILTVREFVGRLHKIRARLQEGTK